MRHFFHEQTRIRIRQAGEGYSEASIQGRNQAQDAPAGRSAQDKVEEMMTKEQVTKKHDEYNKRYDLLHPEVGIRARRKWRISHRDEENLASRKWYKNNLEKCRKYNRDWKSAHPRWRGHDHARYLEKQREWIKKHRATLKGNLNSRMSRGVLHALGKNKLGYSWESWVGYTVTDLKRHLESKFLPGMSWKNMGKWHIDHIIPKSFFQYEKPEDSEFQYCWSLCNLQPLWASDNCSKHKKLSTEWKGIKT